MKVKRCGSGNVLYRFCCLGTWGWGRNSGKQWTF